MRTNTVKVLVVVTLVNVSLVAQTLALWPASSFSHPLIRIVTDYTRQKLGFEWESKIAGDKIACRDEDGNVVDWFVAYKLPKIPGAKNPLLQQGSSHSYLVPNALTWIQSSLAINDSKSLIGQTMKPLTQYKNMVEELAVVLYNDQPPDDDPVIKDGHTKGVMLANARGGFWMPHSIPHFPKVNKTFYPPGGLENGQMLFCLSLPLATIDEVLGGALHYTKAKFYNSSIPTSLQNDLSSVQEVIQQNVTAVSPYYDLFQMSLDAFAINVFAKGPKFHREVYADWIAPHYSSNFSVQSWLNGVHPFLSNCTTKNCSVLNILEKTMGGQAFSSVNDHSKWAVSQTGMGVSITCIGDLNRQKPQKARGGVVLCVQNVKIWQALQSIVTRTQPCTTERIKRLKKKRKQRARATSD